jgi:hypothetical protein
VNEKALAHWWLSRQKQTENVGLSGTQLYSSLEDFTFAYKFCHKREALFPYHPIFPCPLG